MGTSDAEKGTIERELTDPDRLEGRATLTTKLAEVMGEVERVPKTGFNSYFKYKFATEADILEAVRAAMAQRHVMLYHECLMERAKFDTVKTRDGETTLVTLPVQFTFVDGDTGESRVILGVGQATDNADKGIYKALTGAVKYLLLKTFLMSTGDDPEDDRREAPGVEGSKRGAGLPLPETGKAGEHLTPVQMNALLGRAGGAVGLRELMAKYTPDLRQFSDLRQEHYGILVAALES